MTAALLTGHGGLERLCVRDDVPVPVPAAHEVLIRVGAAGINNTDINLRTGWYSKAAGSDPTADAGWSGAPLEFPRIQGADACGRIVAVGTAVAAARIGERVLVNPVWYAGGRPEPIYFGSDCDVWQPDFPRSNCLLPIDLLFYASLVFLEGTGRKISSS